MISDAATKRLGNLDLISRAAIGGWYINSEGRGPASLRLYADGALVAGFAAQEERTDVSAAGFGDAECGFHVELPHATGSVRTVEIVDAADNICVWRIDMDAQKAINNLMQGELPAELDRFRASGKPKQLERDETGLKILFDVSDLVYYIGHHDNLTGIQRVQSSVIQAMVRDKVMSQADVGFIAFDSLLGKFQWIDERSFLSLLADMSRPRAERAVSFDQMKARTGHLFPRGDLKLNAKIGQNTVISLLGAAWVIPDYVHVILDLKRRYGVRFVPTFHDLIPIYAKETCDQGTAEVFKVFLDQILRHVDVGLCVSENTARDLERYCAENGIEAPPTRVTRNGSSLEEFFPVDEDADKEADPVPQMMRDPYVLFVSTIEGRKNHLYAFQIWERLVNAGVNMPRMVCVGRLGWRSEAFLQSLLRTDNLGGRFQIVEDISDAELKTLYQHCEFTIYPSQYEGWGLPIGESLSYGKPCVLTNNSSLPEVAGDLGVYIPGNDIGRASEIVRKLIEEPGRLAEIVKKVENEFQPVSWAQVAERVLDGCRYALTLPPRNTMPVLEIGREYTFSQLRVDTSGLMGQQMLDGLLQAHKGPMLGDIVTYKEKILGLESRSGFWYTPEPWGTWVKGNCAELCFEIGDKYVRGSGNIIFYAFIHVPLIFSSCNFSLILNGCREISRTQIDACNIVLRGSLPTGDARSQIKSTSRGRLQLHVKICIHGLTENVVEEMKNVDSRDIRIGLNSIVLSSDSDTVTRIRVLERIIFRLQEG